jgi:hypothetical protein
MTPFNRDYWIQHITRLVNRDYRPNVKPNYSILNEQDEDDFVEEDKPNILYQKVFDATKLPTFKKGKTFSEILFDFIDKKGIDEVELYQSIDISRALFSKIRTDDNYRPERKTVYLFIIGMRLNMEEAIELMKGAGYIFHSGDKTSWVIHHCIGNGIFNKSIVDDILIHNQENPLFSEK